jgi:hypothetical protein
MMLGSVTDVVRGYRSGVIGSAKELSYDGAEVPTDVRRVAISWDETG